LFWVRELLAGVSGPILVIDDDLVFLEFLRALLSGEGYEVVAVASLAEARAWLGRQRPAVVIGDARIAGESDFAVVDLVAGLPAPPVPLLLTTAYPPARVTEYVGAHPYPALSVLFKPFEIDDLLARVAQLLTPA
jgi:DNA-binding NtrC family response regulator